MSENCDECGVGSRGAFLTDTDDGRTLCQDCRGAGECRRCGRETTSTTLSGEYQCDDCGDRESKRDTTRDANQGSLDDF